MDSELGIFGGKTDGSWVQKDVRGLKAVHGVGGAEFATRILGAHGT